MSQLVLNVAWLYQSRNRSLTWCARLVCCERVGSGYKARESLGTILGVLICIHWSRTDMVTTHLEPTP